MANVLLIDPPWYVLQNICYGKVSYGLASIAAVLKANRHNCIIYNGDFGLSEAPYLGGDIITDLNLYRLNLKDDSLIWKKIWEKIKKIIKDFSPLIVGITIPTAKYSIAMKIANRIKNEFSDITIIVGGPHPTIQPLETAKELAVDVAMKGEGEHTFLELVNAIEKGLEIYNIPGIAFKHNFIIQDNPNREYMSDLDSFPFPAWDCTYEFEKYPSENFGAIFTSRGCPYQCIFCASHKIWSRQVRCMSAERVVAELRHTSKEYKTNFFRFNDDTFILNKARVTEICEKIRKTDLNIRWMCEVRADLCTYGILKIMKSAGCVQVNIGVETGNPEVLKYIKKEITLDQVYRAFDAIRKAKLEVATYFMIGFPNETVDQIEDSIRLMNRLRSNYNCWSIATPYPGTELYDSVIKDGLLPPDVNWSYFFHQSPMPYNLTKIRYNKFISIVKRIQDNIGKTKIRRYITKEAKKIPIILLSHPIEFAIKVYKKISRLRQEKLHKNFI